MRNYSRFERLTKRFGTISVGIFGKWAISWAFDFLLYPVVLSTYGILVGGVVMTFLSFLLCYGLILFYDGTKKDWLGIETLKEIEDFKPRPLPENEFKRSIIKIINYIGEISAWIMKKSDAVLLIFLSIKFDPFITVIHIRHGAHQFNGLSKRDWKIFITSIIIGNAYWTLAVYLGITIVQAIWNFIIKAI